MKKGQAVVVTTEHRGVFFGLLTKAFTKVPEEIILSEVRNCVYWDRKTHGFIGLASNGPGSGCRVGPAAKSMAIKKVTAVAECSKEAVKRWREEPWS